MARVLNLGEVLVRKDLRHISIQGRPKIGYPRQELLNSLEEILGFQDYTQVVIAGAGKLGRALMRYNGFEDYGLRIIAAFDTAAHTQNDERMPCPVYPVEAMKSFCQANHVCVGVITVPLVSAQKACNLMIDAGITRIWNFAPCRLNVPDNIAVQNENLALSLAHLCRSGQGVQE